MTIMKKVFLTIILVLLASFVAGAEDLVVNGVVKDKTTGETMVGAVVLEIGTRNAVLSDINGCFTISVNKGAQLEVSFLGYVPVTIKATPKVEAFLSPENEYLDASVVTGYTKERIGNITGAVSVVNMKEIAEIPTGNVMASLECRVPGVNVSTDGAPGGYNTSVLVRGITTINDTSPLYVIDGVPTRVNVSTVLNARDVESIQVLRDAASAAIYGAQAANGVIVITTKRAESDQTSISYDATCSFHKFVSHIPMLNAQEWGEVFWKAYQNDGLIPAHSVYGFGETPEIPEWLDADQTIKASDTDWQDQIYRNALTQDHTLTAFRGAKNGSTTFSINYMDDQGIIIWTNFKRLNARIASDYSFYNNKLRVGENFIITYWNQVSAKSGIEEIAIAQHPLIPVYDINGNYAGPTTGLGDKRNPVAMQDDYKDSNTDHYRLFGNIFLEYEPVKNLVFKTLANVNLDFIWSKTFNSKWQEGYYRNDTNELYHTAAYNRDWLWTNTVNYNVDLGRHSINAVIGSEAKKYESEDLATYKKDFLLESLNYRYMSAGEGEPVVGGSLSQWAIFSLFAKVNYAFANRYLISGTIRRDASSRFGKNNNAGVFPSVSIGWRITEEPIVKKLLQKTDILTDLKIRASYGINGNDQINNYATYDLYYTNKEKGSYDFNGANSGVIASGAIQTQSGNPDVTWESTTQTNYGFDLSMFNNRLHLSFDDYCKYTTDMLIVKAYQATVANGGYSNGASISNLGLEGVVSWTDRIGSKFQYSATFNLSYYSNRVNYNENAEIQYGTDIVGQPMGSWYGWKTDGLFRTNEELDNGIEQPGKGLGRIRYVDVNNDNVINDNDRDWLGHPNPRFIGGLNLWMGYGRFDLSVFFSGMVRDVWNSTKTWTDFSTFWGNHGKNLLKAWDPDENFNSSIPALSVLNLNNERRDSDYFIEDGSYIRLKVLTLGYNLHDSIAQKLNLKGMRVYVQGQNLLTFTNYSGADPEVTNYNYPMPQNYILGVSITF